MRDCVKFLAVTATALLIAGCGDKPQDSEQEKAKSPLLTAATLGEQTVLTVSESLSVAPYSNADRSKGAKLSQICRACHSLDKGGPNTIGPALHGFFGTDVASRAGFEYSPAMQNADFVWTPRALDAWLANPGSFLPGNRMTFAGIIDPGARDSLIAYLLEVTTTDGSK